MKEKYDSVCVNRGVPTWFSQNGDDFHLSVWTVHTSYDVGHREFVSSGVFTRRVALHRLFRTAPVYLGFVRRVTFVEGYRTARASRPRSASGCDGGAEAEIETVTVLKSKEKKQNENKNNGYGREIWPYG